MKLFRPKSNTSTPQSQNKGNNRLSRILGTNRSRASIDDAQSPSQRSSDVYSFANLPPDPNPSLQHVRNQQRQLSASSSGSPPSLPPLPVGSIEDSFMELPAGSPSSQVNGNTSQLDERDMNRKLMDVESSFVPDDSSMSKEKSFFVPEPSRWPHTRSVSPDREDKPQTYLQYGPGQIHHRTESLNIANPSSARVPRSRSSQLGLKGRDSDVGLMSAEVESTIPDQSFYTAATETGSGIHSSVWTKEQFSEKPLPQRPYDEGDDSVNSDGRVPVRANQELASSPIVAAAQRREGRLGYTSPVEQRRKYEDTEEEDNTPKQPRKIAQESTRRSASSLASLNGSVMKGRQTPIEQSHTQTSPRPSRFQSRQNSQYSTISSAPSTRTLDDPSDITDYALQTGGARSGEDSYAKLLSADIPRSPSLGSVASSINQRSPQKLFPPALPMAEPASTDFLDRYTGRPVTPPASSRAIPDVTDTILAQHVRDVHVPDTIAKDYRASHIPPGTQDFRPSVGTPQAGAPRSNLTLKEQNTKIDKLTKENFDLKLKIHFLSQALQARSEEGVRELISKNASLQAELVKAKKEAQALRKRVRELEKLQRDQQQQQELADAASVAQSTHDGSAEDNSAPSVQLTQIHDDVVFYRERASLLETENEKLAQIWQSVLDEEVVRRKQVEKEAEQMRLELSRVKERHAPEVEGLQQEIARLKDYRSPLRRLKLRRSRPNLKREDTSESKLSLSRTRTSQSEQGQAEDASLSGTTAVDQLRQENAELRRNLGAQTSMLASRNRERERLQGEIEDLKLVSRRGDSRSVGGDSILDRSVSRNQQRPLSRASMSGYSQMSDLDRDRYEALQARLRDENAMLRMRNQDLQRDVNNLDDMRVEADADIEQLSEAVKEMEDQLQAKEREIEDLLADLGNREQEANNFRQELLDISDGFNRISDDREETQATIESLQQDLANANRELENMEQKLRELNNAKERLEVQQESSTNEIAFLREEQENDKVKIGELQTTLDRVKSSHREEESIMKEVEELGAQASRATEEARKLRKALAVREKEAGLSAEELGKLEQGLRGAVNDFGGSRTALVEAVAELRRNFEDSLSNFASMKHTLSEREDEIVERDGLLDASNLEIRRLTELINTERQAHRLGKSESPKKTQFGDHSALLAEIEMMRLQERKRLAEVEMTFNEQLKDRNTLLLALWTRLCNLCGSSWAERHNLSVERGTMPTLEVIENDVTVFTKTIGSAIKHVEANVGHFRSRLHSTEEQIWQDFQTLDIALQERAKRLENLEAVVKRQQQERSIASNGTSGPSADDLARLSDENKILRRELKQLKHTSSQFSQPVPPSPISATASDIARRASVSGLPTANPGANASSPRSKRFPIASADHIPDRRGSNASSAGSPKRNIKPREIAISATANASVAAAGAKINGAMPPPPAPHVRSASAIGSTAALGMGRSAYNRAPSFHRQLSGDYSASGSEINARPATSFQQQHPSLDSAMTLKNNNRPSTATTSNFTASNGGAIEADASWLLRLQEMQRRLEREREGRLLDRDGARTRLEEGRKEVENLKRELERVKARNQSGGSGGVGGGGGKVAVGGASPGRRRGAAGDSDVD